MTGFQTVRFYNLRIKHCPFFVELKSKAPASPELLIFKIR